jgi:hypothetical protein
MSYCPWQTNACIRIKRIKEEKTDPLPHCKKTDHNGKFKNKEEIVKENFDALSY